MKSKLRLYLVVITTPKTSREKSSSTFVGMQQSPEIEKKDSENENSSLKWTKYNGWRKVCINFKTDMDKLITVVYSY